MRHIHPTPRHPSRYFHKLTYEVKRAGKKWSTIHYVDGENMGSLLSKNKKIAIRKGEDHLKNYVNY